MREAVWERVAAETVTLENEGRGLGSAVSNRAGVLGQGAPSGGRGRAVRESAGRGESLTGWLKGLGSGPHVQMGHHGLQPLAPWPSCGRRAVSRACARGSWALFPFHIPNLHPQHLSSLPLRLPPSPAP